MTAFSPAEIRAALKRSEKAINSVALTYGVSLLIGVIMVSEGNSFALVYRDNLVNSARSGDPALIAYDRGQRFEAALIDFSRNLALGGVPSTLSGLGVILAYPIVAYRGWVGGIVSVNDQHVSRLATPYGAFYYFLTVFLQLVPYSIAGGVGVKMGVAYYRNYSNREVEKWLGIPKEAILDVLRVYILIVPLYLMASLWEFLAP